MISIASFTLSSGEIIIDNAIPQSEGNVFRRGESTRTIGLTPGKSWSDIGVSGCDREFVYNVPVSYYDDLRDMLEDFGDDVLFCNRHGIWRGALVRLDYATGGYCTIEIVPVTNLLVETSEDVTVDGVVDIAFYFTVAGDGNAA